jgi:cytochrome c-type biogenesis protein CcmH
MIAFVLAAGAMVLAACLLLLWPLLGRGARGLDAADLAAVRLRHDELSRQSAQGALDPDGFAKARDDLARRLLEQVMSAGAARPRLSLGTTVVTVLFVTLASAALYWKVGTPQAMDPLVAQGEDGPHGADGQRVQAQIRQLEEKLAKAPDDADGWIMLGRSYATLDDYAKAVQAYAKAARLKPRDPQLLVDFADSLAMAQGRKLQGEPLKLIETALGIDPRNIKGLLLAGTAAYEAQDFKRAAALWERVLPLAGDDRDLVAMVERNVAEARAKDGAPAPGPAPRIGADTNTGAAPAPKDANVSGRVTLSASLNSQASPDDNVFIFARAAEGPRMPLAVIRTKVRDLPKDFTLDDSLSMAPELRISGVPAVVITARVSKSGDPAPRPGDLQGQTAAVKVGTRDVRLEISEVVK